MHRCIVFRTIATSRQRWLKWKEGVQCVWTLTGITLKSNPHSLNEVPASINHIFYFSVPFNNKFIVPLQLMDLVGTSTNTLGSNADAEQVLTTYCEELWGKSNPLITLISGFDFPRTLFTFEVTSQVFHVTFTHLLTICNNHVELNCLYSSIVRAPGLIALFWFRFFPGINFLIFQAYLAILWCRQNYFAI